MMNDMLDSNWVYGHQEENKSFLFLSFFLFNIHQQFYVLCIFLKHHLKVHSLNDGNNRIRRQIL